MKCPVCGNEIFDDNDHEYDTCQEHFWTYDSVQVDNSDFVRRKL